MVTVRFGMASDRLTPICRAGPSHVPALADLQLRTALAAYDGLFPPDAPRPTVEGLAASWSAMVADPEVSVFAVADGLDTDLAAPALLGCVAARPDPGSPGEGEITRLYVRPDSWGRGLGRRLLDVALADRVVRGCGRAGLWVLADNHQGRAFYERLGWRLDPTRVLHGTGLRPLEVRYTRRLSHRPR
jgi:GNAT superfamily N-acetyltransferase